MLSPFDALLFLLSPCPIFAFISPPNCHHPAHCAYLSKTHETRSPWQPLWTQITAHTENGWRFNCWALQVQWSVMHGVHAGHGQWRRWHDDVMRGKPFSHYWSFVREIHWWSTHRSSIAELWCFPSEQPVERTVDLSVICWAMTLMWRHCHGIEWSRTNDWTVAIPRWMIFFKYFYERSVNMLNSFFTRSRKNMLNSFLYTLTEELTTFTFVRWSNAVIERLNDSPTREHLYRNRCHEISSLCYSRWCDAPSHSHFAPQGMHNWSLNGEICDWVWENMAGD